MKQAKKPEKETKIWQSVKLKIKKQTKTGLWFFFFLLNSIETLTAKRTYVYAYEQNTPVR